MSAHLRNQRADPVTSAIVRGYELSTNDEMGHTIANLGTTPGLTTAADFSCACLSDIGDLLTTRCLSLSMAYGVGFTVRESLAVYGDRLAEGDTILCNDPYRGGGIHASDVNIVVPIISDGQLVMWAGVSAHITDVGGVVFGSMPPYPVECYGESTRWTPVKICEKGILRDDLLAAFLTNVRNASKTELDLKAMIAATAVARIRLQELIDRYGAERLMAIHDEQLFDTERAARQRVAQLPTGTFSGIAHLEHDGVTDRLYPIRVDLARDDDLLTIDFSRSAAQAPGVLNCTITGCYGQVAAAVMPVLFPDLPFNEGCMRALNIKVPLGLIVSAIKPAPVGGATALGAWFGTDAILEALGSAISTVATLRHRRTGAWGAYTWSRIACINQAGQEWLFTDMSGGAGGGSALAARDGESAIGGIQTLGAIQPNVEDLEARSPILFLYRRLARDSGGPGRFRGGLGLESAFLVWDTDLLTFTTHQNRHTAPASGVAGGLPGSGAEVRYLRDCTPSVLQALSDGIYPDVDRLVIEAELAPTRVTGIELHPDDGYYVRATGGPGYGDPLERDPAAVVQDVRIGSVSMAMAERGYGVMIDDGIVDDVATAAKRSQLRQLRVGVKDHLILAPTGGSEGSLGIDGIGENGSVDCDACGNVLFGPEQDPTGAVITDVAVSGDAIYGKIVPRAGGELRLKRLVCRSCGRQLAAEVRLLEDPPSWLQVFTRGPSTVT